MSRDASAGWREEYDHQHAPVEIGANARCDSQRESGSSRNGGRSDATTSVAGTAAACPEAPNVEVGGSGGIGWTGLGGRSLPEAAKRERSAHTGGGGR